MLQLGPTGIKLIESLTTYRNHELLLVGNDSADPATLEYQDPCSRNYYRMLAVGYPFSG